MLMRNNKTTRNHGAQTPEMIKMTDARRPFGKLNVWLMCGCLALMITGFLLMLGPGSSIEEGFNAGIFSARRIAVGPALAFLGFLLMAFAIVWDRRPAGQPSGTGDDTSVVDEGPEN